ncbi:MAG TPA: glycosyltransferase family 2 protein [bacterium]|nr:glycosyltransferase family 2 protein [bacterium]
MKFNNPIKISCITTAYDNHPLTKVHVRECMNGSRIPDEIIVVNDHGDPCLKEMLKELDLKTRVVYAYINEDIQWNYTGARNLGVWLSSGDYIVNEDNDHIPSKNVYEAFEQCALENPTIERIVAGKRPRISLDDALNKPVEEWNIIDMRQWHRDTYMMKRSGFLKLKGYDERFAGAYAWACADWRRRINRAGIKEVASMARYYVIMDEHITKLVRRKSYRNYELARERDGHTQSPKGILNFSYQFEVLNG